MFPRPWSFPAGRVRFVSRATGRMSEQANYGPADGSAQGVDFLFGMIWRSRDGRKADNRRSKPPCQCAFVPGTRLTNGVQGATAPCRVQGRALALTSRMQTPYDYPGNIGMTGWSRHRRSRHSARWRTKPGSRCSACSCSAVPRACRPAPSRWPRAAAILAHLPSAAPHARRPAHATPRLPPAHLRRRFRGHECAARLPERELLRPRQARRRGVLRARTRRHAGATDRPAVAPAATERSP